MFNSDEILNAGRFPKNKHCIHDEFFEAYSKFEINLTAVPNVN